jgi:tetratricopeptide (TPR) repeat protein
MGLSCLKLNRFLEARSYFNDVLVLKDAGPAIRRDAQVGIADSYFLEDKLEEAAAAYNDILARYSPKDVGAIAYYRLCEIAEQQGRSSEAQVYREKLQREFPLSFEAQIKPSRPESYSVQAGCFNDKKNADRFCKKLTAEGFDARIVESDAAEDPRYRVKIGRFNSKEEANSVKDRLRSAGYSTRVVPER